MPAQFKHRIPSLRQQKQRRKIQRPIFVPYLPVYLPPPGTLARGLLFHVVSLGPTTYSLDRSREEGS